MLDHQAGDLRRAGIGQYPIINLADSTVLEGRQPSAADRTCTTQHTCRPGKVISSDAPSGTLFQ